MRSFLIFRVGLKPNDKCPYKRHTEERGKGQAKVGAEIKTATSATKQGLLGAIRNGKRQGSIFL